MKLDFKEAMSLCFLAGFTLFASIVLLSTPNQETSNDTNINGSQKVWNPNANTSNSVLLNSRPSTDLSQDYRKLCNNYNGTFIENSSGVYCKLS